MNNKPLQRRHFLGAASVAGASLVASTARALPRGADQDFARATRLLQPYGISVAGNVEGPFDVISTSVRPLPATAYTQAVKSARTDMLSVRTAVFGEVSSFEHFHEADGEIIPCVKTTIHEKALATHELFDEGSIIPCVRVSAEMLEGARIGAVDFVHLHEDDDGLIVPCVKTSIVDHSLATHELFDHGDVDPCFRVSAEMLEGARIGTIDCVHFHEKDKGEIVPCVRTTIHDDTLATHQIFDAARDGATSVEVVTEMLEGARIGAVDVLVSDPNAPLTLKVGKRTYVLVDGALIER